MRDTLLPLHTEPHGGGSGASEGRARILYVLVAMRDAGRPMALLLLALALLFENSVPDAHARGPVFSGLGKIVVVRGGKVELPPTVYLEGTHGRFQVFCAEGYRYNGKAVRVEGTMEGSGICADKITEIDAAELEPKRTKARGPRPASFAEYCRFVGLPAGTFLCTPVISSSQDSMLFSEPYAIETILDHGRTDLPQYLVDMNGDGKPDYCRFVSTPAGLQLSCAVRRDAGFADGAITTPLGFDLGYTDRPRFLADVDGDGRPDYCRFIGNPPNVMLSCALQRDGGYTGPALNSAAALDAGHPDKPAFMVDVDGDGKADYCRFVGDPHAPKLSCTLAAKTGFAGEVNSPGAVDTGYTELGRFMADVNGDGKADFCRFVGPKPTTQLSCLLSDQQSIGPATHQSLPLLPEPALGPTQGVQSRYSWWATVHGGRR